MEWLATLAPMPLPHIAVRRARGAVSERGATGRRGVTISGTAEASDDVLVARIAAGDQRALAEIVRRHGGRLKALALRFTGGGAEADDVVQETFWSLWRNARLWQPGGPPFSAYLTRMAVNRAIDGERRRRVRRFFGIEAAETIADPGQPADMRLAAGAELAAVAADIRALPARQRAAILLAADGERTNAGIAEALGLSVGAVEQLLVRARRTLRARLAARDEQSWGTET